jgi:hypothetical protein
MGLILDFAKKKKKKNFFFFVKKKKMDKKCMYGKNEGFFFQTMFLGCHYKIFG